MSTNKLIAIAVVLVIGLGVWAYKSGSIPGFSAGGAGDYTEETEFYAIQAALPTSVPLAGAVGEKARTTLEEGVMARVAEFKANISSILSPEEEARLRELGDRRYELAMEYTQFEAPDYISYVYSVYEDMLGAHPNAYFLTFTFDKEGNSVELEDLLGTNPNWLAELSLVVSNDVTRQVGERLAANVPEGGEALDVANSVFAEGLSPRIENFQNFYIDSNDLVIIIPPYQAAAWAVGSFEVRLPLESVQ